MYVKNRLKRNQKGDELSVVISYISCYISYKLSISWYAYEKLLEMKSFKSLLPKKKILNIGAYAGNKSEVLSRFGKYVSHEVLTLCKSLTSCSKF